MAKKIKITINYENVLGEDQSLVFEFPSNRKEVVGNVLHTISKFDDRDVTYGYVFLKGEPHSSKMGGVFVPAVHTKVSPNLPKAEEFKKMLTKRVGSLWGEHMRYAESGRNIAYTPSADLKEDNISDFIAKGKF